MKHINKIHDNEWRQRKREDPVNYKGLKKDFVGDVSVIVLPGGDGRSQTRQSARQRQQADREEFSRRIIANPMRPQTRYRRYTG